ncbi:MAG: porin [Candidatus Acidiferrales bacterium]
MRRLLLYGSIFLFLLATRAAAQQPSIEEELRAELARMKEQIARVETLLARLESERAGAAGAVQPASFTPPAAAPFASESAQTLEPISALQAAAPQTAAAARRAPALNTPSALPLREEGYRKAPPRFDVLLQARGDFFADTARNDSFLLRKAELGVKGRITENVDFVIELDPVRANDAFRRTYIRLSHFQRLHVKLGLEKAPLGLEELTSSAQIPFVDRSEVNDRFAPAEELGLHLESHWEKWLLQFSVSNGSRRLPRDDNNQKDFTGRIVWGPTHWFSVGGAVQSGTNGPASLARDRYNAELKLGSNLSGFQTEFYRAQDASLWSSALYTSAFWAISTRREWITHVQPVIRFELVGRSDRDALQELRLLTFGFSLLFQQHRAKFQLNYLKDLHTGSFKDALRAQYQVEF